MRVDKFLKNGKEAKPGSRLKVGDILTIAYGDGEQKIEVLELLEHAPKDKATEMYREL